MGLQENREVFTPANTGTMVDTVAPEAHVPGMARVLRNIEMAQGDWARRRGWARLLPDSRLPCETIIGYHAYRDTQDRLHRVIVGSDSKVYHILGDSPTAWTEVQLYQDVVWAWDSTWVASFAVRQDDLYIGFWQPPEAVVVPPAGAQNLRFAGLSDVTDPAGLFSAFGVSIPAPAAAPTLAAAAAGTLGFNVYNYIVTFMDAVTGQESDASPVATITLAQPDAPDQAPTLADAGAGLLDAGTYEYAVCFLNPATGVRSPLSLPHQITHDALSQTTITNIRTCPEAGVWQREIYRRRAGGAYNLHILLADNTTQVAADNVAADSGVAYDAGAQQVQLTNIPVYAGGGTPANGRAVYRCIYRATGDGTYSRLTTGVAELLDNSTVVYGDNNEQAEGDPWVQAMPLPLCGVVCAGPDNRMLWLNDRAAAEPAVAYPSASPDMPEAIRLSDGVPFPINVGTDDDPITACGEAADGWVVSKRKSYHFVSRECETCTRIVKGHGNVSPRSLIVLDNIVAGLSADGPGYIYYNEGRTWRFIGSNKERFDLGATWDTVVKSRLPYATAFHWPRASMIGWAVQACANWPVGPHNDLCIVWDYAAGEGGRVWLLDLVGVDAFAQVPALGGATDSVEATFAYGVIGKLFDGEHNDGTVGVLSGTVLAVDGNLVDVDTAALGGQDVVGSILWINGGTGTRICRPVDACENARSLIVGTGYSNTGDGRTTLHLAGPLGIAAGSEFEIGGWLDQVGEMLNVGLPMSEKTWMTIHATFR